jgi:hypothetical protein
LFGRSVGWVDKPNVSDGLWIGWVYQPNLPAVLPITAFGSDNTFKPNTPCVDVFCRFVKVGVGIFPTGQ